MTKKIIKVDEIIWSGQNVVAVSKFLEAKRIVFRIETYFNGEALLYLNDYVEPFSRIEACEEYGVLRISRP